jgi:alpha-ketoglutarate-dependent taurine dioxygenase
MKVRVLNGWVVEFSDIDLKQATDAEMQLIGSVVLSNLCIVIKGQKLTPDEQLEICSKIGDVERHYNTEQKKEVLKDVSIADGVSRVTGALNADGKPGLFSRKEDLEWHVNAAFKHKRHPLVWIYADQGVEGSRTSWLNMSKVYHSMSRHERYKMKDLKVHAGFKTTLNDDEVGYRSALDIVTNHHKDGKKPDPALLAKLKSDMKNPPVEDVSFEDWSKIWPELKPFDLYYKNPAGKEGIYFPFYQVLGIKDYSDEKFQEFKEYIMELALKEENMYHHDWEVGDIVLSEQWLTLHKRWAFDGMDKRIVHRIALDYKKVV